MIAILPLDQFTDAAKEAFIRYGADPDKLMAAVGLDQNVDGNYGETWLAIDRENKKLLLIASPKRVSESNGKYGSEDFGIYREFDLNRTYGWYVDNFVSSNRVLALDGEPYKDDPDLEQGENEKRRKAHRLETPTVIVAYCTNARKRKIFAFLDLIRRVQDGREVTEDDPIFEQFNLKCPKCGKVYKDQNRKICEDCSKGNKVFGRLLKYFSQFRWELVTVLLCMVATSAISLISPIINGQLLYDQVITKPTYDENGVLTLGKFHSEAWVFYVIGLIFVIAILSLVINIVQNRANARMSTRVTLNMKMDIFSSMQKLSLSFFNNNQTGRLITRVNYDADRIRSFFIDGVPNLIINGLNFIGLTIFLMIMNWKLTLIVFIPVPIIVLIFKYMLPKLWRMYSKQWRRSSSLNAVLGDSLNGIRVVKAFAKETDESNRFRKYSTSLYEANLQTNMVSLVIFPVISLLIGISSQAIWGFGGLEVMSKHMTYGEFSAYFGYLGMIFGPLNFFTNFTNLMTETINSAQRMFEIIDAVPEITDAPDAVTMDRMKGEIEFKNVNFHYAPNRPILKDVSFHIHPGDAVGLVGHTGAGKSTIANLINRLYDVISGSIEIDGVDVKKIKGESLRRNIAIVSQEIFLFKGTVAENIRYARPDATMEEVITAAKAANAHDFIMRLPDGYETVVGTGSRSLSGGERQRVSIARALLLNPSILILDEATAAMDTETERLIQDALAELIKGKTTITIAHRLSTLKDCNYLMAIENGEIAEQGTHDELIAKKGIYYRLYKLQAESMKRVLQGC
ncbi:MAG: ABC transporter ATP-binding protein/permease [Lachnospiraceae bacterium]|nr:ABC transporter ATP-binding protein/permease [Lachnospiraceae bacterium]